ncbi:rab11 family-interacting protein 5 isoform X3 [Syngnathus scovelli]|uniref:rab11 family-interacting protein 5 isoform X3 n=1 Tax=Syngnathus scovelli TaxID=161590 RepID=UPI00210FC2A8|nr:rab11 family-interacting protein 5 isoform X3 [Syngnathus scovelli]
MEQPWVPTHVQVTVLRGRGLRGKGKHGTSDVYAVIQLAKEKYLTCVAEKTTEPEWREECCFELQPGVLDMDTGPELVLTVMHRAVIGLDVFLGQAIIQLRKIFHESRGVKNQWYRLNSKTGKKEKERGDIQVSVQFTRNNLTASMYDLVMKDKGASTFSKLKERMRGKRRSSEDEATSGGTGPLSRVRQRLPSDGGGEEDYEDDEGGEVRRSKMRTFFLRGKLRKSSDTRSSTSLGSESSESSSRGGSLSPTAGISVVVSDLSNSPSNSSNLTADSPERTADTSPRLSPLRCDFSDEINEITIAVPQLPAGINGTHKPQDQASGALETSLGLGHLQKTLPLSVSLQNLHPRASAEPLHGTVGDGRRWSFDKAGEEESAAIAAAMEKNCPVLGREETGEEVEQDSGTEGKHKGWFGSKESHSISSPHPVRPLSSGPLVEGRSVLEKIKSSIHPGRRSQTGEKILTEGAGSYYHLTHSELIGLLVQREAELDQQKADFQQQRALLAKREVELRKLKPQVRDLEDYIDTLLVRIMEQKPTLLQVRSRLK